MDGVTVSSNTSDDDGTVLVLHRLGFTDASCTTRYGLGVDACGVIASEGHVFDAVTVLSMVGRELFVIRVEGRGKGESELVLPHNMRAEFSFSSFQALFEIRFYLS